MRKFENFEGLFGHADDESAALQGRGLYFFGWQVKLILADKIVQVVDPDHAGLPHADEKVFVGWMVFQTGNFFQILPVLVNKGRLKWVM